MAAPFGFSVGDFINAINLVKDVVQALSESRGSSKEYVELMTQLNSLELALTQVEGRFPDIQEKAHRAALISAVTACRGLVYDFLQKIKKYDLSLSQKEPRTAWKEKLRKIQWRLSMPEELVKFGGKIVFHVTAIGMLLHTIQYASMLSHTKMRGDEYASLKQTLHTVLLSVQNLDQKLGLVGEGEGRVSSSQTEVIEVLEGTRLIMIQQYQLLSQIYTPIPAQILFSPPVILRDAHNRMAYFNLQFIDCWDSFLYVLENRFWDAGVKKVRNGEFYLENSQSGRPIASNQSWSVSFLPGDKVDMSMVFRSLKPADEIVGPACKEGQTRPVDTDKECESCNSCFKRILDVTGDSSTPTDEPHSWNNNILRVRPSSLKRKREVSDANGAASEGSEGEDRPDMYKRVQVHCKPPLQRQAPGMLKWRCDRPNCNGAFPTRSLLDHHANKNHSSNRPHVQQVNGSCQDQRKPYVRVDMGSYVQVPSVIHKRDAIEPSHFVAHRREADYRGKWRPITANIPNPFIHPTPDSSPPSPPLVAINVDYRPCTTPSPSTPCSPSSASSNDDCPTPVATDNLLNFYHIPSSDNSEDKSQARRRERLRRRNLRRKERMECRSLRDGDTVLIAYLDPNRPAYASQAVEGALYPILESESIDYYDEDEERYKDLQMALISEQYNIASPASIVSLATAVSDDSEVVDYEMGDDLLADAQCSETEEDDTFVY